jgi:hypothetical protein
MVVCRSQARSVAKAYRASPSRVCRGRQWVRRDGRLPKTQGSVNTEVLQLVSAHVWSTTNNAGAGKDIPAKANAISVFDLAPLLFQGFVIHN